jgi:hypothetical protein
MYAYVHNPVISNVIQIIKKTILKGIKQMKYFDIKKDGKLIGRIVPTIHIAGIFEVDDLEKTIVGIDKIYTEVSLDHYAEKVSKYLGRTKENIILTYMKRLPDSYPMDMWYMLKGSEGLETCEENFAPAEPNGIDRIFASLFKDDNYEGIKIMLAGAADETKEMVMRDVYWTAKIIKAMESDDVTLIAVGGGHVVREPYNDKDMSILGLMEMMGYDVVEVTL